MNTIFLILKREYLTRVRKKSFIIMTILGPLLIAGFYGLIGWAAIGSTSQKNVQVLDESGLFTSKFKDDNSTAYTYVNTPLDQAKKAMSAEKNEVDALVYIPKNIMEAPKSVRIFGRKGVSFDLQTDIERSIEREIENIKLTKAGITQEVLEDAKVNVSSETISLTDEGEKQSSAGAAAIIGTALSFLIYLSIFIYGAQVMRGVMEEKTNRIVEVIISSVKPYQLMMGKILGVALVGLTQFLLWIFLTVALTTATTRLFGGDMMDKGREVATQQMQPNVSAGQDDVKAKSAVAPSGGPGAAVGKVMAAIQTLNIPLIVATFLFYFLGGYLLYSALFGAVGAAVDNETEVQQFMFPITIPIIFSIAMAQFVMRDPNGALAFWLSIIPLTSPVIMLVRVPLGVPAWELALSMVLLVLGFVGTIWLAARIYRVGILMYGKKASYKELSKWIFYKA